MFSPLVQPRWVVATTSGSEDPRQQEARAQACCSRVCRRVTLP